MEDDQSDGGRGAPAEVEPPLPSFVTYPPPGKRPDAERAPHAAPVGRRIGARAIAAAAIVLLALGGGLAYVVKAEKEKKPAAGPPPTGGRAAFEVPVVAAPVKVGDIPVYITGLGTVTALNTVSVKSRVDGQLIEVHFEEGQVVKPGDLLAKIDPRPFQVQLAQAEGQLARDEALLRNARVDLERYRKLWEQDSIQKQQLDTQEGLVAQYEGVVKIDQAQIDSAKLQLVYTNITASIPGRVGLRQVDAGNIVHATDANGIVIITQLQPITVVFPIAEDSLPQVLAKTRAGEELEVEALDREQMKKLATGKLQSVDNQIDTMTGTVRLKAQFENKDGQLFPNQFVNARLLVDVKRGATVVPAAAVQRGPQGSFVYVVKEDRTVTLRPITVQVTEGSQAAVEKGLSPGEVVVVDGIDKLREGSRVEVKPEGKAAPKKSG